jgi:hypothetical protein
MEATQTREVGEPLWVALCGSPCETSKRPNELRTESAAIGVVRNGIIGKWPRDRLWSNEPHPDNATYQDSAAGLDRVPLDRGRTRAANRQSKIRPLRD